MQDDCEEFAIIHVASIRLPNGRRMYASHYGKRSFPIKVRRDTLKQPRLPGID